MAQERFSKATVAARIFKRIHGLEMGYNFDRDNGSHQVKGMSVELHIVYGEFRTLLDLAEELELTEPVPPPTWCPYNPRLNFCAGLPRVRR